MDAQNIKNLSILSSYIEKCWGYTKEDTDFLKERILNPFIPKEYSNFKFDENFRCSFDVSSEMVADLLCETDEGWRLFKKYFRRPQVYRSITFAEYITNKKLVGKNEVKLKKVIQDCYNSDINYFKNDCCDNSSFVCEKLGKSYTEVTKKDIENYILKAFEHIGVYKPKNSGMKLVISFNYADWLLCSYGEEWTSCLNIEGGGYWKGFPTLIADDNRCFMYVTTEGKKKEWNGIKTDGYIARSWIILSETGDKVISKFYPTSPFSASAIRKITNDNTIYDYGGESSKIGKSYFNSKYDVKPIRFKRDNLFFSIYNDIVCFDNDYFYTEKKLRYMFGNKGGRQFYNFNLPNTRENNRNENFSRLSEYYKTGLTINSEIVAYTCSKCHKHHSIIISAGEDAFCPDCIGEDYERCELCGKYELKSNFVTIKGRKLCPSCFKRHVIKCDLCGEYEFRDKIKKIIAGDSEVNYCTSCEKTKIVVCKVCGTPMVKGSKQDFHYNGEHYCKECIKEDEKLNKLHICKVCNKILNPEEEIADWFENYYCDGCLQIERDKKQIFFDFS